MSTSALVSTDELELLRAIGAVVVKIDELKSAFAQLQSAESSAAYWAQVRQTRQERDRLIREYRKVQAPTC